MWNPHHPRIFLHEDDDDDTPPRGDTADREASGDIASAPPDGTGAWPPTRTTARNTAGPDNIDDKRGRKRRNSGNARKEAGRWPQPPHWQATGGRGKKRGGEGRLPGVPRACGTRFEGPKLPASDLHLFLSQQQRNDHRRRKYLRPRFRFLLREKSGERGRKIPGRRRSGSGWVHSHEHRRVHSNGR